MKQRVFRFILVLSFIVSLVTTLAACSDDDNKVTVQDENGLSVDVEFGTLSIFCDVDKRIGIAYKKVSSGKYAWGVSATLSAEQYNRYCATAAEKR
jgi:hypothetical protein